VSALAAVLTLLYLAADGTPSTTPSTAPPRGLPTYELPESCVVAEYDKLGRALTITCNVNPDAVTVVAPHNDAIELAESNGYDDGFTAATESVVRAAVMECEMRAMETGTVQSRFAVTALDMCAKMKRSLTAQFIN
jgi:hypothetical protein